MDVTRATQIIGDDGVWIHDVNWKEPKQFSQRDFVARASAHDGLVFGRLLHVGAVFLEALYRPSAVYHLNFVDTAEGFRVAVPGMYRFTFVGDHGECRLTSIEYLQNESHE